MHAPRVTDAHDGLPEAKEFFSVSKKTVDSNRSPLSLLSRGDWDQWCDWLDQERPVPNWLLAKPDDVFRALCPGVVINGRWVPNADRIFTSWFDFQEVYLAARTQSNLVLEAWEDSVHPVSIKSANELDDSTWQAIRAGLSPTHWLDVRDNALFALATTCALTPSEISRLAPFHISLLGYSKVSVQIAEKSNTQEQRWLIADGKTGAAILKWKELITNSGWVQRGCRLFDFPRISNYRYSVSRIEHLLHALVRDARHSRGIPQSPFNCSALRNKRISELCAAGYSIEEISYLLGVSFHVASKACALLYAGHGS